MNGAGAMVTGAGDQSVINGMQVPGVGDSIGRERSRVLHPRHWQRCAELTLQLMVTVPLPAVSLQVLTNLRSGQVVLSSWPSRDDVPLVVENVFLANVTFEAAGLHLGVRISGFERREVGLSGPAVPRIRLVPESIEEASTDQDHTMNDILLPTSLCFGRKTMTVQQIRDLTSGDAIVLERAINAPVSMLAAGRVVAQGELVSVKGCFGVRLSNLAELSKRLPFFHSELG